MKKREREKKASMYSPNGKDEKLCCLNLVGESLDEDGHEQVEEDIVAERHQGDKVERRPVARLLHAGEEYNIPVLLCQDLRGTAKSLLSLSHPSVNYWAHSLSSIIDRIIVIRSVSVGRARLN